MEENKFTYEDVFNALNSMDEEKRAFLLEKVTVSSLLSGLNSEEGGVKRQSKKLMIALHNGNFWNHIC